MRTIRNCSVAVAGGAGFLGSHLVNHLIEDRHCRVLVIDNLITGHREFVHPDARFEYADITASEATLFKLFKHFKIHHVFNYAAEPYIPVSFERPLHVFEINAMGALKLINAAQDAKCESILQVSSAEIYGNGYCLEDERGEKSGWLQLAENAPVIPHSSYGAAKAAIDALVQVRWREARTPVIALRQFNCVGERETHPYVVPEIIGQLARQIPADVQEPGNEFVCGRCNERYYHDAAAGEGGHWCDAKLSATVRLGNNSFRDFLYAGDAVRMAVELLEAGKFGEVYNLGSESGVKVYDLAERIGRLMGFAEVAVVPDPERVRPWEIWHLQSDNSKINSVVKSRPQVSLDEGLRRTINWYWGNGGKWPWEK